MLRLAGAWLVALAAVSAVAQTLPAQPTPEWAQVETVEVKARPGPAMWHLMRGNSEVWVLGLVGALPKDLDWNKAYLSDALDGANAILLPPEANVGLVDIAWFLLMHGSELSLPRGQALESSLPENVRASFVAARTALGKDEDHYRTDTPIRAAIRLQQDFQDKANLSGREPRRTIENLADDKKIRNASILKIEAMDTLREILRLTPAQQQACLAQSAQDVTWGLAHVGAYSHAWAMGDIRNVKANYVQSRLFACIVGAVPSAADIDARSSAQAVTAIDEALNKPGKTIAVVNIGTLLRKDGVLERLQSRHIAVEGPAD